MTGSAREQSQRSIACRVCAKPIPLETSNTDECGRAVHEDCYTRTTISRFRRGSAVHISEGCINWICLRSLSARIWLKTLATRMPAVLIDAADTPGHSTREKFSHDAP